jgi:threonine synthase
MRYYSTRRGGGAVSFGTAALAGLAADGGLFVPEEIPRYSASVENALSSLSFIECAYETVRPFVSPDIPNAALADIVSAAFTFGAPLVPVDVRRVLELFHGPTAAFKDFGARFMAHAFAYLRRGADKPLTILVATSGDTGGAVAGGFFAVEGISVTVLYPKGRVSPLQERQIAGLGGHITALAVEGSFDDCQRLVKNAFSSKRLASRLDLSSANSINIARLIPQMVYYASGAAAFCAVDGAREKGVFCVPSGNFGNLTAGLYAMKRGAPIARFIAATNINKTVPEYLESGVYTPMASLPTISNAMDVGAPSNFERMQSHWSLEELRRLIIAAAVTDDQTRETIRAVHQKTGYILDPHGAVGFCAASLLEERGLLAGCPVAVLETAHPAKFAQTVEPLTGPIPLPPQLREAESRAVRAEVIPADDAALESILS